MAVQQEESNAAGGPAGLQTRPLRHAGLVGVAFLVLVGGAYSWGQALTRSGAELGLKAPPLHARLGPDLSWRLLPALLFAGLVVAAGPRLAAGLSWRRLLAVSGLGAGLWAVLLASAAGWDALASPVLSRHDALAFLPQVDDIGSFLSGFTDRIATYPVHVQGHPPGLVVLLSLLDRIGLATPSFVAGMYITAGAAIAPAVLVTARSFAGGTRARLVAPWLVIAPYAIWVATSADALYAGVGAWAVALVVTAGTSPVRAAVGGALFGAALFLTYGAAALVLVPVTACLLRRSPRPLVWAAVGGALVFAGFAAGGFWWFDGLAATRVRYYEGLGGLRPYGYFLVSNLAALAIAAGPATMAGLSSAPARESLRTRPSLGWMVLPVVVAVVVADLSGLSKGEVERIWLLFTPWLVAAAGFIPGAKARRWWLAAGAALAVTVQAMVVTPW